MKHIARTPCLESLLRPRTEGSRLIILNGLPGCGKTSLLNDLETVLRQEKPPLRIVRVNGEEDTDSGNLLKESRALGLGPSALLIDNIGLINDVDSACRSILESSVNTTIWASCAYRDEAEQLGKACISFSRLVYIPPLLYPEFCALHGVKAGPAALDAYALLGGMPANGVFAPGSTQAQVIQQSATDSFILRHIIERNSVRNPFQFRQMLGLVAGSVGTPLSSRSICRRFAEKRSTISPQGVLDYLGFAASCGLLLRIPRHNRLDGGVLEGGAVWYFADTGYKSALGKTRDTDDLARSHLNLAVIRLVSDGWQISQAAGNRNPAYEGSALFTCRKQGRTKHLFVISPAAGRASPAKARTELLGIPDAWPKIIAGPEGLTEKDDGITVTGLGHLLSCGLTES